MYERIRAAENWGRLGAILAVGMWPQVLGIRVSLPIWKLRGLKSDLDSDMVQSERDSIASIVVMDSIVNATGKGSRDEQSYS
jgi:hypothetical protein